MSNKTISQALKDVFLGLGGNPSELSDNQTASDYIEDLESAIKGAASGAAGDMIDDSEASATKTYSSSKIESLIPDNELPTPAVGDIGKVVSVVSDGDEGAEYALETPASGGGDFVLTLNENSSHVISSVETWTEIKTAVSAGKNIIVKLNDYTLGKPVYFYGARVILDDTVGGDGSQLALEYYGYNRDEGGVVFMELNAYESDAVNDKIADAFFNSYVCATVS